MKKLILTAIIFLSACSTSRLDLYSPTLGTYNFNYGIDGRSKAGVIQVFDDGKDTYFKLYRPNEGVQGLTFVESASNALLKVNPIQRNLIQISGVHDAITVGSGGLKTYIKRLEPEVKEKSRCKSSQGCHS